MNVATSRAARAPRPPALDVSVLVRAPRVPRDGAIATTLISPSDDDLRRRWERIALGDRS